MLLRSGADRPLCSVEGRRWSSSGGGGVSPPLHFWDVVVGLVVIAVVVHKWECVGSPAALYARIPGLYLAFNFAAGAQSVI